MSHKSNRKKRTSSHRRAPQTKPKEKVTDDPPTSFRETEVRKNTLARTKESHQALEARLLSASGRLELYRGLAAGLHEHAAILVLRILEAAEAKEAWACKLILELAGIPQGLQAVLGATESCAPEIELMSALERSLVENLLSLIRGENREPANTHFSGE